jgi:hypothetical protein
VVEKLQIDNNISYPPYEYRHRLHMVRPAVIPLS